MQTASFKEDSPGKLVRTEEKAWAFVPDPIPREILLEQETICLLADADHALGHLGGATGRLVNPFLVASPLLHREAILSSRIEGTITTPEDLVLFEAGGRLKAGGRREDDAHEVANYMRAMQHGLKRLQEIPVCLRLIRELHAELLRGVRGERERPGEFRAGQNYIAKEGQAIHDARFVPPPAREMSKCLDDFEKYLNQDWKRTEGRSGSRRGLAGPPLLVRLALVHYQFEAIHPFRDGNGRIGRLLIPLLLCSHSRLREPLLYLSSYFERKREAYYDLLLRVSLDGDWASWVQFFLRGVEECSIESSEQAAGLLELRGKYHGMFQRARSSALLLKLIDRLFQQPSVTRAQAADYLDITAASASSNINKLLQAGIVQERTGRKREQVFVATEILDFMFVAGEPRGKRNASKERAKTMA